MAGELENAEIAAARSGMEPVANCDHMEAIMTKEEILAGESELLEFKRDVPEQSVKYIKTVVAFANGKGGTIVFGVDDKTHKIVGIKKSLRQSF